MFEFFAGCDTHKAEHSVCIINKQGEIIESFSIQNNLQGWMQSLQVFRKYENILVGIENHANYAKLFSKFLINNEIRLKEVNPVFTGKKRKANTRKGKTDEIDSFEVARITRDEKDYLPDISFNEKQEQSKLISKQRNDMVNEKVRLINRLHAKLMNIDTSYKKTYGKELSSPKTILLIEKDFSKLDNTESLLILRDIKRLKSLQDEIIYLESLMVKKQDTLIQNLDTFSGIGIIRAFELVSLIGDILRFKNENHFASYVGASPVKFASGSYSKTMKNRGGQRTLHCLIMQITRDQKKYNPEAKKYYQKKLDEGKTEKQAMISLQRKIVKLIYFIYKYNQPYNYSEQHSDKLLQAA